MIQVPTEVPFPVSNFIRRGEAEIMLCGMSPWSENLRFLVTLAMILRTTWRKSFRVLFTGLFCDGVFYSLPQVLVWLGIF